MKKYQSFYLKFFFFLEVKFSIYLNRFVFVMYVSQGRNYVSLNITVLSTSLRKKFLFGILC